MELVFATNNKHKLYEIRNLVNKDFRILGLKEAGIITEIPETQDTIEGNAMQKASFIYEKYGFDCFADDTGLEVDALNGEPGVFSARYSMVDEPVFPDMDITEGNIHKLLLKMQMVEDRSARFRTVIALIIDGQRFSFEGIAEGEIMHEKEGESGFGYDPVFLPKGFNKTFAQMSVEEKNRISHRARASMKLSDFLFELRNAGKL